MTLSEAEDVAIVVFVGRSHPRKLAPQKGLPRKPKPGAEIVMQSLIYACPNLAEPIHSRTERHFGPPPDRPGPYQLE